MSPAQRLNEYLGLNVSPEEQAEIERPRWEAVQACMAERGFEYELPVTESNPLAIERLRDPAGFGGQYGYGFFLIDVNRVDATPDDTAPSVTLASDDWIAAYEECAAAAPSLIAEVQPPAEVFNRAYEVREQLLLADDVVAIRERWSDCMLAADLAVKNDLDVQGVLAERLADVPLAYPEAPDRMENPWVITPDGLDALIEFERSVYAIDTGCRAESGLAEAEAQIDADVLAALIDEFGSDPAAR